MFVKVQVEYGWGVWPEGERQEVREEMGPCRGQTWRDWKAAYVTGWWISHRMEKNPGGHLHS